MNGFWPANRREIRLFVKTMVRCLYTEVLARHAAMEAGHCPSGHLDPQTGSVAPVGDAVAHGAKLERLDIVS